MVQQKLQDEDKQLQGEGCTRLCAFVSRGYDDHVWDVPGAYGAQDIAILSHRTSYPWRLPRDEQVGQASLGTAPTRAAQPSEGATVGDHLQANRES